MEKYVVSACLAGIPCRYNKTDKCNKYIKKLVKEGYAIPLCPEQLGGLPTPREACECKIINGERRVVSKERKDYTKNFYDGAKIVLDFCKDNNIKKVILQDKSPSCGMNTYDGTFTNKLTYSPGITTELLIKNEIEVISSKDLDNNKYII